MRFYRRFRQPDYSGQENKSAFLAKAISSHLSNLTQVSCCEKYMIKVSIITPVFNGASTIRDCLESINYQTYKHVEHIIIDAASTDSTLAIIQEYPGENRRLISEKDEGLYDGMNKGLRMATGDIIGILNSDDMYHDNQVLSDVVENFEDKAIDTCYGDLVYFDPADTSKIVRLWRSGAYRPGRFRWGWMLPHPTFFVRRSLYAKYGRFDTQFGTAADYELMLRFLLKHGATTVYLPRVLVKMRSGGVSNAQLGSRLRANRMDRKAWVVNGLRPYPWTLALKPLRKIGQWFVNGTR